MRQIVCAVEEKASKNDGESLQDIVVAAEQMDVDDAEVSHALKYCFRDFSVS